MKLNSTVTLTLVLLTLMVTAGVISGVFGTALGREALKGVTQPDTRPTNNLANSRKNASPKENLILLKEEEIIASARARINGTAKERPAPVPAPAAENKTAAAPKPGQFPFVSQNRDVVLEVTAAAREGDNLVLNVNLRNNGKQPVRFLYTLLNISDEKGQELSASTDGLPAELPSESETFTGTISVPATAVESANTLSLSLTDYPDQQLKLQLSNIPIAR
jgi:hypothetical protein